jgi:hypothetical protein
MALNFGKEAFPIKTRNITNLLTSTNTALPDSQDKLRPRYHDVETLARTGFFQANKNTGSSKLKKAFIMYAKFRSLDMDHSFVRHMRPQLQMRDFEGTTSKLP